MAADVARDHLAQIRIEGMHCHRCERTLQKALGGFPGVYEVEVDFASGLASVLYERGAVTVEQLMNAVTDAGYRALSCSQRQID